MATDSFGHYELRELLGRGGMGQVFRAYDSATDRIVALKVLPPHMAEDDEFQVRFRREARIAASLNDPHVVPIHSYGEIDGRLYVDMRLIEGRDLDHYIGEHGGRLSPERAVAVIEQVAAALDTAREEGLIHRDVKPSNILITTARDFVYLIDFGIARAAADTALTHTGHTMGTVAYMAPERFRGSTDHRADVYSLACVLYECLAGVRPYPGESFEEQLNGHLNTAPPRPSTVATGISPALDEVVARGMAKDPDQRYQTAIEFADAARATLTNTTTDPVAPPLPPPYSPPPPVAPPAPSPAPPTASPAPDPQVAEHRPRESRRLLLGVVGISFLALAAVTALVIVLVTHDSPAASNSTTSAARTRGRTTDTASPASSTSPAAPGYAALADYSYLLIQGSDLDAGAIATGPPVKNFNGVPSVSVTFANSDRTRTLDDLLIVYADTATATQVSKDDVSNFGKYVTGDPQPFEIGTNGWIGVGLSPDKSKSVTYVTFSEGKVDVDLEFHSAPGDPAPRDAVVDAAQKQDAAIKSRMPG